MQSLPSVIFRFSGAEFEQLPGSLRADGQTKRLRPQTAAVLAKLLEHAGQLVTHDQLVQAVWGDTIVTDNSLAQCISEIRGVLGPTRSDSIETVPRRGYILRGPVTQELMGAARPDALHAPVPGLALNTELAPQAAQPARSADAVVPAVTAPPPTPVRVRSSRLLLIGTVALTVLVGVALWLGTRATVPAPAARISLAVLPFQSRTTGADLAWFGENVGEDLTTNLSRIPGSHVVARVSTQSFPAVGGDVRAIGRDLGVRYLVAGSVDREGEQVRMNLQLIDAETGAIRWTERFETPLAKLQGTQRLVADRIANTLHVQLVAREASRIESHAGANLAADELALEAWAAWNRGSPADVARAKELAQKALALDERSVLAWKTIASWHLRARISQSIPAEVAVAGAEAAAQKAMAIDPEHPLVHTVYGAALALRGKHEEAQRALEHEIATNPSHPVAYSYLGLSHLMRGQPKEAIAQYQSALAISPRDPRISRFQRYLALAYLHDGDLPAALRHAKAATQVPIVDRTAWATLAAVCALSGDQACAETAVAKLRQFWPTFSIAQGESEWPPARAEFTARHAEYLRGLKLAGLPQAAPQP
jgi:TolB-like protein/DNA-binding winged helix-turn-helix (wHTH) protein